MSTIDAFSHESQGLCIYSQLRIDTLNHADQACLISVSHFSECLNFTRLDEPIAISSDALANSPQESTKNTEKIQGVVEY